MLPGLGPNTYRKNRGVSPGRLPAGSRAQQKEGEATVIDARSINEALVERS